MEAEAQSVENNVVPAWCVGNHLPDPSFPLDAAIVEAEGSAGVRMFGTDPPRIERLTGHSMT